MMRMGAFAIVMGLFAGTAVADSTDKDTAYGTQILIPDIAATGILLTATFLPLDRVLEASAATYALGGPIVHCIHGNYGRAAASFGVRVALPAAGLMLGDAIVQINDPGVHPWNFDGPPSPWWLLGGIGGLVGASLLDGMWLAGGYQPKREAVSWTPTARATHAGVALGVAGSF